MRLSGKTLLRIDRFFWFPYRLAEILCNTWGRLSPNDHEQVVVIKFMGMGSLIQFASVCEDHEVDKSKITLITLAQHLELCQLMGFENARFIRTDHIIKFLFDLWHVLTSTRTLHPSLVVDYERCSNAAALFRTLLTWAGQCPSVSFETRRSITSVRQTVYSVDGLTQHQLLMKGIEKMPKSPTIVCRENIRIHPGKIIININASNYLLARRYPINSFAEIIRSLYLWNTGFEFFLTGTFDERTYTEELVQILPGIPVQNVCGKWNLKKFTTELMNCSLLITGDSGPLHLAVYLGTSTVAVWGPTQPQHFGYESKSNLANISLSLSCSPCLTHPNSHPAKACQGKIRCIKNLSHTSIVEKSISILSSQLINRRIHFPAEMHASIQQEFKSQPSLT